MTSIGDEAFYECTSLKDVYYTGSEVQWKKISIGDYNDPLKNAVIHYNSPATVQGAQVFNEKKYIADIWLGHHVQSDVTIEPELISGILELDSLSDSIFEELKNDKVYQGALGAWNGLKAIFDTPDMVETVTLKEQEIFETLILDLIEKQMTENGEQIENVLLDAVDLTGRGAKSVTRIKGLVDDLLGFVADPAEDLLSVLKTWKFDPNGASFQSFYAGLNDLKDTADRWSDQHFVKDIGDIASVATDVSDFFKRFSGYAMAVEMSEEMNILLNEMAKQTKNVYLKEALIKVAGAMDNANYASVVCTLKLTEDLTMDVIKACFDGVTKAFPVYRTLRVGYKVGVAFDNLMFNTSGSIDAYYLTAATSKFIQANKAAIDVLAKRYQASGSEKDAGAYVFAMQTYSHVIEMDLESGLEFVKAASQEGLVNAVSDVERRIGNWIYGTDVKSTYQQMLESKDSILKNIGIQFYWLRNSWKLLPHYLKTDYPDVYPIYAAEEYAQEQYKPLISDVYLNEKGETLVRWKFSTTFRDPLTGEEHTLYGLTSLDGVSVTQNVGGKTESKRAKMALSGTTSFFDRSIFATFPKGYAVSGFVTTQTGDIFTQESAVSFANPCSRVELFPFLNRSAELGIRLGIFDASSTRYQSKNYHIYRSVDGKNFSLLANVPAMFRFGGSVTTYTDQTAQAGKDYYYYVTTELTFTGGLSLKSDPSRMIAARRMDGVMIPGTVQVTDYRVTASGSPARAPQKAPGLAEQKGTRRGIVLSWSPAAGATGYEIYRKVSYGAYFRPLGIVTGTTYTDTAVEDAAGYEYMVVPVAQSGDATRYDLQTTAEGEVEPVTPAATPGDVDADGKVTASDARLALRCAVGLEEYASGSAQFLACDVDRDDRVTASDARLILRAAVGLETLS